MTDTLLIYLIVVIIGVGIILMALPSMMRKKK